MPHYDIATKVLIDTCRDEIVRSFTGIAVRESALIEELPQETASLRRSDYPILTTDEAGVKKLVILEFQTRWDAQVPLRLLEYRTRHLLKHAAPALSCVVLLTPSRAATEVYADDEVRFAFRLVRIYDMDAETVVSEGPICLLPFVPLMKNGPECIDDADRLIVASAKTRLEKADMLTGMAVLAGLVSKTLPAELISKRKDIMIESAAYDIIKEEGLREGRKEGLEEGYQKGMHEGLQKGIEEGIEKGRQRGYHQGVLHTLRIVLEMKFAMAGITLFERIRGITDTQRLESLMAIVRIAETPEDVVRFLDDAVSSPAP